MATVKKAEKAEKTTVKTKGAARKSDISAQETIAKTAGNKTSLKNLKG